jgi:hydroxypyruvate reductase
VFDVEAPDGESDDASRSSEDATPRSGTVATAVACLDAGVERADPVRATREAVSLDGDDLVVDGERYALAAVDRVVVVGAGKGADRVAAALVDALDGRVDDGIVVVDEPADGVCCGPVTVRVGDHPVPSERGVDAARAVRELVAAAGSSTLVLGAITGGASALLAAPAEGVGLDAMQDVTRSLLGAGATIDEVNAVRKHASAVKGGRLAVAAAPARVVTVAVSDVVGDDPAVIGSGPTAPDGTTFADALAVLSRYDVDAPAVRAHLGAGAEGSVPETPSPSDGAFEDVGYHVVASARTAVAGAVAEAERRGFEPLVLSTTVTGEARECGAFHAAVAREVATAGAPVDPPAVLVSAGETTVRVTGDGRGGPNQEFALGSALALAGGPALPAGVDVAVAAVDTDGRDGSTDAAGAVLHGSALAAADDRTTARDALARNDATGFLESAECLESTELRESSGGGLLRSGATGTNVNDLRVMVVDDRSREPRDFE